MKRSDPVSATLAQLPSLLERRPLLIEQGRFLDVECLLGSTEQGFHVSIRAGRITDMTPAPVLMRSWQFAYRATPQAWTEFWQTMPKAGWHDLLSLTKRGEAPLEGAVRPFLANLQYFKDVLALPRATGGAA